MIWTLDKNRAVLGDRYRNRQAEKLLIWLSKGVDEVREGLRKARGPKSSQRVFRDYLLTVQADTDSQASRERRAEILRELLGGLFERKDDRRGFTLEQRRLIWHSDEKKRCISCRDPLSWENFTIDHVDPWSRGGKTTIRNAALMCRTCNSRKGAKRRSRRI